MNKSFLAAATLALISLTLAGIVFTRSEKPSPSSFVATQSPKPSPSPEGNIVVYTPSQGDEIGPTLKVTGKARVFENQLSYRLSDSTGLELVEGNTYADAPDVGQYGIFEVSTVYKTPRAGQGVLEVFVYSAKDGSEAEKLSIPISFSTTSKSSTVLVYFGQRNESSIDVCRNTYPLKRTATVSDPTSAIKELLAGLTPQEKEQGYFTSINEGVSLNSLKIQNFRAFVDFDEKLQEGVGGSCRVTSIREQITKTLLQFSTIKEVVISINGRTEDILQP
jgi:hypothetical protein